MSRSGYTEDLDAWPLICWRGAVAQAIRGKRGQKFLHEMLAALDAMPAKRLIAGDLVAPEGVCALGAVAVARGLNVSAVDEYDPEQVAAFFGIAHALSSEISYMNDDGGGWRHETPEERFARMRSWVESLILEAK